MSTSKTQSPAEGCCYHDSGSVSCPCEGEVLLNQTIDLHKDCVSLEVLLFTLYHLHDLCYCGVDRRTFVSMLTVS